MASVATAALEPAATGENTEPLADGVAAAPAGRPSDGEAAAAPTAGEEMEMGTIVGHDVTAASNRSHAAEKAAEDAPAAAGCAAGCRAPVAAAPVGRPSDGEAAAAPMADEEMEMGTIVGHDDTAASSRSHAAAKAAEDEPAAAVCAAGCRGAPSGPAKCVHSRFFLRHVAHFFFFFSGCSPPVSIGNGSSMDSMEPSCRPSVPSPVRARAVGGCREARNRARGHGVEQVHPRFRGARARTSFVEMARLMLDFQCVFVLHLWGAPP